MPQRIDAVPLTGPFKISVTVSTGDGEHRNDVQIGGVLLAVGHLAGHFEDTVAYEGGKAANRAFRTIVRKLVERTLPDADEKTRGLVWRTTLAGLPFKDIETSEEFAARRAHQDALHLSWRYRLWEWFFNQYTAVTTEIALTHGNILKWVMSLEPR